MDGMVSTSSHGVGFVHSPYHKPYASKATANTALGIGIGALALGAINWFGGEGFCGRGRHGHHGHDGGHGEQNAAYALMCENALLKAEIYTDNKIACAINPIKDELAQVDKNNAVTRQALKDFEKEVAMEIINTRQSLSEKIKLEAERRECGDKSIMCYVDGHCMFGKKFLEPSQICSETGCKKEE